MTEQQQTIEDRQNTCAVWKQKSDQRKVQIHELQTKLAAEEEANKQKTNLIETLVSEETERFYY